jgi:hypothetical protein
MFLHYPKTYFVILVSHVARLLDLEQRFRAACPSQRRLELLDLALARWTEESQANLVKWLHLVVHELLLNDW